MSEQSQTAQEVTSLGEEKPSANMIGWQKRVSLFMTGQAVSMFGSFLVQYAIMWHLTLTTKSGLVLALAAVFGFLPQAIVSILPEFGRTA